MNKRAARKRADEGGISIGELRQMIADNRGIGGMSIVNPAFTKEDVLDIFDAALAERDDEEIPAVWKPDPYSRTGGMKRTADHIQIQNVLRECAKAIKATRHER